MNKFTINMVIISLLISFVSVKAQISYHVGVESGYYSSGGTFGDNNNLLLQLNGQLKYIHTTDKTEAKILFEGTPTFYGTTNTLSAVKLKGEASYIQKFDAFNWGINLIKRNYFYNTDNYNSAIDIYYLQTNVNWRLANNVPVQSTFGLAYQDIDNDVKQKADLVFLDNKFAHRFDLYSQLNYGVYVERYVITNVNKNEGWRLGPQLGFNHLKSFVFKIDYRFLTHFSDITTEFSYEHWVRLLTGKLLSERWSIFLMADYNFRDIKTDPDNSSLAYSLIDSENHVYMKIAFEPAEHIELSMNAGYFNENYFINDALLKGWNLTFGIKYGK